MRFPRCIFLIIALFITPELWGQSCVETTCGPCFRIHARFEIFTGDGMQTLWRVGSDRLLCPESGTDKLEEMLRGREDDFAIFGDFVVCPRTKERDGEMRHVCIQDARNLRLAKRKKD